MNTHNRFELFLKAVELLGNRLPDLTTLFLIACFVMLALSFGLSFVDFNYFHPTTHEKIVILNMLTPRELIQFFEKMTANFINFPPLGIIIVVVLGIGIAESSGFVRMFIIKILFFINRNNVIPVVIILSIFCHLASDSVYVILMPISALMFYNMGRHPLAGIGASFAGLAGGFSASYTPSNIDPIMQAFTQQAARIIDPSYSVNVLCNYFLAFASTFGVLLVCWYVTAKIVEPFLWKNCPLDEIPPSEPYTPNKAENKAFFVSFFVLLVMIVLLIAALLPANSLLRAPSGSLTSSDAPAMKLIVPLLFLFLALPGFIYGRMAKTFKTSHDFTQAMCNSTASLIPFIVFCFFCGQFLYIFSHSNIGTLIAIAGAEFLKSINIAPQLTIAGVIILTGMLNLIITSATSKWAILAPILVPMLMSVGIAPELTQAAFRISDSAINVITPLFPFYPLLISFCQVYYKKAGIGTLSSMMLPYSIGLFIILSLMLYGFWFLNIPLGFESRYTY